MSIDKLKNLKEEAVKAIEAVIDLPQLNDVRVKFLGKKGPMTEIMKGMSKLSNEERPLMGKVANEVREAITTAMDEKHSDLEALKIEKQLAHESIDVTLPSREVKTGSSHILTQVVEQLEDLFIGMGYSIVEGPEVEQDHYNFEMLNLPKDHPARDMQDTFYITDEVLMRTHTSPVQARTMEKHDFANGPIKIVCPGKVYRRDSDDATHSHQFTQIEGLVIDKHITMSDLKGTLTAFAKKCLVKSAKFVCVQVSSHSLNLLLKWISHVSNVVGQAVTYVKVQAGLKFSEQEWYIPTS